MEASMSRQPIAIVLLAAIDRVGRAGYSGLRSDTIAKLSATIALYLTLGFRAINQSRDDLYPGALCFE